MSTLDVRDKRGERKEADGAQRDSWVTSAPHRVAVPFLL